MGSYGDEAGPLRVCKDNAYSTVLQVDTPPVVELVVTIVSLVLHLNNTRSYCMILSPLPADFTDKIRVLVSYLVRSSDRVFTIYSGDVYPIPGHCFQIQHTPTSEHKDLRLPLSPCLHTSPLEDMKVEINQK
jgi:hypothetical protein